MICCLCVWQTKYNETLELNITQKNTSLHIIHSTLFKYIHNTCIYILIYNIEYNNTQNVAFIVKLMECSRIKERIPVVRETEPLLDIDRNEKKFIAFLKSHVPKLCVDDIKKFMPATINLDPFLRKLIKGIPSGVVSGIVRHWILEVVSVCKQYVGTLFTH